MGEYPHLPILVTVKTGVRNMIRIILTSTKTNKEICYHTVQRMDEAERHAETYSRMEGIKVEVVQKCNVI
jgi:hypothetical protein